MIGWMPEPAELVGEFQRAEHVVGVGQRERGLAVRLGELRQLADGQRAFQQRIGRVHVQVHETGVGHVSSLRISWRSVGTMARRVHMDEARIPAFPGIPAGHVRLTSR